MADSYPSNAGGQGRRNAETAAQSPNFATFFTESSHLSGHLNRLEEAGMVAIDKRIIHKRPKSTIQMTTRGRKAVENHWKRLDTLRHQAGGIKK